MIISQDTRNTIKLLRIPFSIFLAPVFLLALSQQTNVNWFRAVTAFLIIHLFIYPASNGYNSYVDRDETSIGGLEKPPLPTLRLFYTTLAMDGLALLFSVWLLGLYFAGSLLLYILASRAYSSRQIRLKKYPYAGFLIVAIFQGGFTYYMSAVGISGKPPALDQNTLFILLACSFQIAGAYPLTQIYQHEADAANGDITLSYRLGYRGTFAFTALMFACCTAFYFLYFNARLQLNHFLLIQVFFIPVVTYFGWWFLRVYKDVREANFRNTMRMNLIASACLGLCFSVLIVLNHFV